MIQSEDYLPKTHLLSNGACPDSDCSVKIFEDQVIDPEGKRLSKNAMKKLLRHQNYLKQKALRREQRREKIRLCRSVQNQTCNQEAQGSNGKILFNKKPESTEINNSPPQALKEPRLPRSLRRRDEFLLACKNNPTVVVDCGFDVTQTAKELSSLAQQLMYTYGVNRSSKSPFRLILLGLSDKLEHLLHRVSGVSQWTCDISKESLPCYFSFDRLNKNQLKRFVYLTADSSTTLESLEPDHIYIIGGLVDRNRFKQITMDKAQKLHLSTAKLPILSDLYRINNPIFTVNQVFAALQHYFCERNWEAAMMCCIPKRKRAVFRQCEFQNASNTKGVKGSMKEETSQHPSN